MSSKLEARIEALEEAVRRLELMVRQGVKPNDWRSTFGSIPDDEMSREAARLGREYRDRDRPKPKHDADP